MIENVEFLRSIPMFNDLRIPNIKRMVTKSITKKYPALSVILRQGYFANHIYFVKSGRLKVINILCFVLVD